MKDLASFDYPIERIVLVDNFISAFALQIQNGIPILPFYDDKSDTQLEKLQKFIEQTLVSVPDVRPVIEATFFTSWFHEAKDVRGLVGRLQEGLKLAGSK